MEWVGKKTGASAADDTQMQSGVSKFGERMKEGARELFGRSKKHATSMKDRAVTSTSNMSKSVSSTMGQIHKDITRSVAGGFPCPEAIEDCYVLDLDCDNGRDAYVLSKLVGPKGKVVGIDSNKEQIDEANKYVDYHMKQFGYQTPNVEFKYGHLENLKAAGVLTDYFDVVLSNFVIDLSEKKAMALTEAYQALKNGGEIYYSEIFSDKEIPEEAQKDEEDADLRGALYWKDFHKICSELGFPRPILVSSKCIPIKNKKIEKIVAGIHFVSATYRIFKIDQESIGEAAGRGAKVTYKGSIMDHQKSFKFAEGLTFPTGTPIHVDAKLAAILKNSRFAKHFDYESVPEDAEHQFVEVHKTDPFSSAEPCHEE
jgi:arsenite methyltransferase